MLVVGFCVLLILVRISVAQDVDSNSVHLNSDPNNSKSRIHYDKFISFFNLQFDSVADFSFAKFDSVANFINTDFRSRTDFGYTKFKSLVNFNDANFKDDASFKSAEFEGDAKFYSTRFEGAADFSTSKFFKTVRFYDAQFDSTADFMVAHFENWVDFGLARFNHITNFTLTTFNKGANFDGADIDSLIFLGTSINGEFTLGSIRGQSFDFTRAIFLSNARLVLKDQVRLNIQAERLKYIVLGDHLTYSRKSHIIQYLKSKSFSNDKSSQLELDYIFAKSTMYQNQSDNYFDIYEKNKWYEFWDWPKWFITTFYYWTMGLGYRPFRLIFWVLAVVMIYAGIFMKKTPERINAYIFANFDSKQNFSLSDKQDRKVSLSFVESLLNCVYFSTMLFFTIRLKGNILIFFNAEEKKLIITEWFLGVLMYVAFLTLSKAGSIIHNLKDLFIGQ